MIPAYLTPGQIARACGDTTRNVRRKLARAGILEADGSHRLHVSESRLRERLPDMYERVFKADLLGEPGRARTGPDVP